MTLSTQTSKTAFTGNGVSTVFPLPFPFLREADIRVLLRRDGVETPLSLGTHYGLSGAGSASGGSLTMQEPPATGQALVVYRAPAIVQETDYVENSAFPAETHEAALDLLTMICQSLQEQLGRAVLYPVSTPEADILDSADFLETTTANRAAAQASELSAIASASSAAGSADQAFASAAAAAQSAAEAPGVVKVSASDTTAQTLSSKLAAGDGLAETLQNPGGAESLQLSVALAASPGLEFNAGLLRVRASTGLVLSASGAAVDVGSTANKIVQLDAGAKLPAVNATQLTGLPASFRNRIINGDMAVDERNSGAAITPAGSVVVIDRWKFIGSAASKLTFQQVADAPGGFKYSLKATVASQVTAAATDVFCLSQFIEGQNIADLGFGGASPPSITISLWAKASVAGTYACSLRNGTASRRYVSAIALTTAWARQTVTLLADSTGTWATDNTTGLEFGIDLGSGSNYTAATADAWGAGGARRTAESVGLVNQPAGATLNITGVQLERGGAASDFEPTPYAVSKWRCQRYYQRLSPSGAGIADSTTTAVFGFNLAVPMRAAATISQSAAATISDVVSVDAAQSAVGVSEVTGATNDGKFCLLRICNFSGLTAYRPYLWRFNYCPILFNAEL